jgi:hypothetical protein
VGVEIMEGVLEFPAFPLPFIPSRRGRGRQDLNRGRGGASDGVISVYQNLCYSIFTLLEEDLGN